MNKQRILVLMTLIASPLFAQESTATPCSKGDIVLQLQCLDQAIIDHKRTRQTWITKLEKQVELKQNHTGNTQLFLSFQRSKNSFDSYISDNCQWRYLNELPDTKQAALKYKRCELKIIDQQVEILKGQF
jgi:transcription termination factor NusB